MACGRAVRDDFRHVVGDFRRIVAHHGNGIGAHGLGILHEAIECVAARLFEHRGILRYLAAEQRAQRCNDIYSQSAAANNEAEDLAECLRRFAAGDIFRRNDNHQHMLL